MKTIDFIENNNVLTYSDKDVFLYFSTNKDGVSNQPYRSLNLAFHVGDDPNNVLKNRYIYAKKIDMDLDQAIFCKQTHSNNFKQVTYKQSGFGSYEFESAISNCDALYTFDNNLYLNGYYADCTPIYFYSKVDNLIGIIHAGWLGTTKQITKKTLKYIIDTHNIKPYNIHIVIGPCINFQDFKVHEDVVNLVTKMDNFSNCIQQINEQQYIVDIKKLNYLQCLDLKITNIEISNINTFCNNKMFSYRENKNCGRMCATIVRKSDESI